ncbi:glycoside hydrolase family 108 protein [Adhaeribacter aquaticus]|uniref:glycoside hydrolase family 108 protein n=1 Tax=Adhaeribacter aquaticus TaxID=299567 RepID=UPI0004266ED5|nr:glycosyl hydrolase 108 family protein [Adhaeribacter aquaticus]
MANFLLAYNITKKAEGGWSDNPKDRGGQTWKGVARNMHPKWKGWELVDNAKKKPGFPTSLYKLVDLQKLVLKFYKIHFWDVNLLDQVQNQEVANEIFDTGVNMGPGVPVRFVQRAINFLNKGGQLAPNLKVDGVCGPATVAAINQYPYPTRLLKTLNGLQVARYVEIVEKDPTQEVFANGWIEQRVA